MRLLLILMGLFILSLVLLGFLQIPDSNAFDQIIPDDILALVVLSNPPSNWDFLGQTKLKQWLDLNHEAFLGNMSDQLKDLLLLQFVREVESIWFFVHHLSQQQDKAWRVHFTALLVPHSSQRTQVLELPIKMAITRVFGAGNVETSENKNILTYTGRHSGQVLYQIRMPDYLMISNSVDGWQKTLRAATGSEDNLSQNPFFQKVKSRLRIDDGLFLYFRADQLFPLLPKFGYLISWQTGQFSEQYYEVTDK